jgi:hypothetical protein
MADVSGLSTRMRSSVAALLPKIAASIAERTSIGPAKIDLATAENWLLRPELITLCNDAIAQKLTEEVCHALL